MFILFSKRFAWHCCTVHDLIICNWILIAKKGLFVDQSESTTDLVLYFKTITEQPFVLKISYMFYFLKK